MDLSWNDVYISAYRDYTENKVEGFEETLRRVLGEVLPASKPRKKTVRRRSG